jgi:hypothetical protein
VQKIRNNDDEDTMLIEFRFKNFLSFRDEQVFSLVASPDKAHPNNTVEHKGLRLLRSSAVYGANASGKSNFIKAIRFVQDLVRGSTEPKPGEPIGLTPFKLNGKSANTPSLFELTFVVKDVRYTYGFLVSAQRVHEEWLYAYPHGREQMWFERKLDKNGQGDVEFGPNLKGENKRMAARTLPNALFLSRAAMDNHVQLTEVYMWFFKRLIICPDMATREGWGRSAIPGMLNVHKESFMEFIRGFDLGFEDMEFSVAKGLRTFHKAEGSRGYVPFVLEEESNGTRSIIDLAGAWLDPLKLGMVIVMDELEASLHPLLSRKLVRIFHSDKMNKGGSQLVFATHETTLMDLSVFRRDQIWFTDKDTAGASHLYSLYDFKNKPRLQEAIQKGYLTGRYGAIPLLTDIEGE